MPNWLFDFFSDAFCYLLELFRGEFEMRVCKAHISFALHGNEVDVCVRYLQSEHALTDLDTGNGALDGTRYFFGKDLKACQLIVFKVEDIIHFALGNHQSMTLLEGTDIEEGVIAFVLSNLVARYFAGHNTGKDGCHILKVKEWLIKIDTNYFKLNRALRHFNLCYVAYLLAKQSLSNGGFHTDLT